MIWVDLISGPRQAFAEIGVGVQPLDLTANALDHSRTRDKTDRFLELFRRYVNAFGVTLTRAGLLCVHRGVADNG